MMGRARILAGALGAILILGTASVGLAGAELSFDRSPREATLTALAGAEADIVAVVYKFEDPAILEGLREAAARGVRIRLLLDGKEARDRESLADSAEESVGEMRRWDRDRGKLHAKFLLVDGVHLVTGSFNWTRAGSGRNVEVILDTRDPGLVGSFAGIFERLWAESALPAGSGGN